MNRVFDVAVIGVGAMGSAACFHLARAGQRVLGLDRFGIPNSRGSSHGITRILRLGLHESDKYVPLVLRALELWRELGELAGQRLFHAVGSLDVAKPESKVFSGSLKSCQKCDIEHEVLEAAELHRRFPAVHPDPEMMAVYQPGSGFLRPEACISAHAHLALAAGAELHGHEGVLDWRSSASGFQVRTDRATYEVGQLLFTGGAWLGRLLGLPVEAERTVLGWFAPVQEAEAFLPERLPVWILDSEECGHFYGFPIHGIPGFKLGSLREEPLPGINPDEPRAEPTREDEADIRQFVARYFPAANGPVLSMATCFFENTPDRDPLVGRVPGMEGVWVVGGFSGHGFKYASVMGEIAAELVLRGETRQAISAFAPNRFS